MQRVDALLNKITMYRLVVYVLGVMVAAAVLLALMGWLPFSATAMIVSLGLLLGSAYAGDYILSRLFNIPSNMESWLITGLILFLIVQPANSLPAGLALVVAGAVSSASKYLLTWHRKHFFNPAAFAAAFLSLWGLWPATWWIGSSLFWPLTLILGVAVVSKIRRFHLFLTFLSVSVVVQAFLFLYARQPLVSNMQHAIFASPLFFLGTIMLTEPATMPSRRNLRIIFAALVAVLYVFAWQIGPLIIYPEVALLLGNLFAFAVTPGQRVRLRLKEVQKVSEQVYNYVFQPDRRFAFLPGQYMEWTLPHVPYDSRGNRRTLTIASSPTEEDIHVGVKYHEPSSAYKATLRQLAPGDIIFASHLAGDFTLDGNQDKKLAFIAGGIGITPFRSMIKYLTDEGVTCDITLLYAVNDPHEFAYVKQLKAAAPLGVRFVPVVTRSGYDIPGAVTGRLSSDLIAQLIPDYAERLFYVSGTNPMVEATQTYLHDLNVPRQHIKTDHFSGY